MSARILRRFAIPISVVIAVTLAMVVQAASAKHVKRAAAPTGKPIIIGADKALSGFMSSFDVPPLNGARLAVQDINNAGGVLGRPLKIISQDYHSKPQDNGPAARDLISKGANLILTACDFDLGSPGALVANTKGVLVFSDCAGAVQFGPQVIGPLAYTMGNAARSEGAVMAEFAIKVKHLRTAWTLTDPDLLYYKEVNTGFETRFKSLGGKVVGTDTFHTNDASIATQINHLRGINPAPQLLFIAGFPTGGSAAIRQIRAAGFAGPMMSSNTYDGDYWKKAAKDLSNFYYANYASIYGDDPNSAVNTFVKKDKAKYGVPANSNLVTGYSVVQAFALAATKCKCLDGKTLAHTLDTIGTMKLLVGPTKFSSTLHIDLLRRQEIMQITNGKTHFLQYWTLKTPPPVKF
jgi:branched-chain amino acid transport system substrate-binding protein